ncbi:unnamed protein product [Amoebophrya sp. A120]|nr:unnamed protein product [Amoebophrya sp. A120]|eukprot:GSA120T00002500001.1
MGAALSDQFLLSPYYYSVLSREEEPTQDQIERVPIGEPEPIYQMRRAKELVKLLGKKLADVPFLTSIYKRWELDMGQDLAAFRDKDLESFFADIPKSHFWAAWVACVIATPILERSTKLWLLFNVGYRKYKRLKPGSGPPRGNVGGNKRATATFSPPGEDKKGKKTTALAKLQPPPTVDSRKLLMDKDAVEDLLFETLGMLSRLFDAETTALTKKHIGTLVQRSEFQIFPIKLEQAVTIIKEDQTYNAICRLFTTLLKPQLKALKLTAYRLPAPYVGPLDFALDADWTKPEKIAEIIPKTIYFKKKVPLTDRLGVKLSVCEICFLNVIQRILNQYVGQVHAITNSPMPADVLSVNESKDQWRKKRKRYVRAKLAFMIRRCVANLRSLCEMVRFQLPLAFKEHMENLTLMLQKAGTPFQAWIVRIFQAVFNLPKKAKAEPRLTLKDVVLGVVGRDCSDDLADQIVYLAEHSTVESNQVLNGVPLHCRKMLTFGTPDSIPLDDRQKHSKLCIGDLILHQLVDETYCRQLMDETGLTEYDAISKEKYLQSFVPPDFLDLCSDEFDRVVAHRYMADREEGLKEHEEGGVLIPKPNTTVQTLSQLRQTEFNMSRHMAEGQRRKEKLLKLKEKVEADLAKENALEEGLQDTMEHTSMHCLSLMEKIRLEDDYDKQEILLNKHVLAKFYEERAKRRKQKLPALSTRSPSPSSSAGEGEEGGSPLLSSRGRLRKDRRGLSPEALLTAADLSMRRKKRKKKKHHRMFEQVGSLVPATGQKAAVARQQAADRLGLSYLPAENLDARVDHLKDLSLLERLFEENLGMAHTYENQLLYSKYAMKVAGKDKIKFVPKKAKDRDELKEVIADMKRATGEDLLAAQEVKGFLGGIFGGGGGGGSQPSNERKPSQPAVVPEEPAIPEPKQAPVQKKPSPTATRPAGPRSAGDLLGKALDGF